MPFCFFSLLFISLTLNPPVPEITTILHAHRRVRVNRLWSLIIHFRSYMRACFVERYVTLVGKNTRPEGNPTYRTVHFRNELLPRYAPKSPANERTYGEHLTLVLNCERSRFTCADVPLRCGPSHAVRRARFDFHRVRRIPAVKSVRFPA